MPGRTSVTSMDSPPRTTQPAPGDLLTSHEAAEIIGVSVRSLYRWEESGDITPARTPGGHRRYLRADVEALLRKSA